VALEVPEAREVLSVELEPFSSHRVSLVAARDLPAGTVLAASMLTAKAPQRGLSPALLPSLLGRRLLYDVSQDQPITFGVVDL